MSNAHGQRPDQIPAWSTEMQELAPGVYAYVQSSGGLMISNAGLVSSPERSVAVDALFAPRMTRAFLVEAANVSTAPLDTLISTHHHIDHTLGNYAFRGHVIIAHELTRAVMSRSMDLSALRGRIGEVAPHFAEDMKEPFEVVLPNVLYQDRMTVYAGDHELQLSHVPTAHTVDDTLVYLPEQRILFAGDLCFFYVTPLAFEGSILGWIDALDTIKAMNVERIVPGHGPVGTPEHLGLLRGYFELIRDQARALYDAGVPAEEAVMRIDLGPYRAWNEPERIAPNTLRLYQDFAGGPWQPLDATAQRTAQARWLQQNQ